MTEFDRGSKSRRWRGYLGAELREEVSEFWQDVRQTGIERRREEVRQILEQPVRLPLWLDELLTECREEFTPRQVEALVYRYGYELTHREAAEALGLRSRHSFRKRLDGAEVKVRHLRGDVLEDPGAGEQWWLREEEEWVRTEAEREAAIQRELDYVWPLTHRQRRWERAVDRLWGLQPA